MEKLGVATDDLVKELKAEYLKLVEYQSNLIKTAGQASPTVETTLEQLAQRIDELEGAEISI
jgi:hypothetical protein